MLRVFDTAYQVSYSDSYTGNVHGNSAIEGYHYCMSFLGAFESLMAQSYTSFILGVRCIVVGIYCCNNCVFKIFDSHGRDLYGNSHPEGTCVLLEVPSVSSLVQYIQSLYQISDIFEVKGIKIAKVNLNIAENNNFCPRKQCCPLALYSLCYSVIKPCIYWDYNTLAAIVNIGTKFYHGWCINSHLTINDLPKYVTI